MIQLMKFPEATSHATGKNSATTEVESSGSEIVVQLRHRLIHNPCADSDGVRIAILGELLYQCYKQLAKNRYL
jgi:hypothetical protein